MRTRTRSRTFGSCVRWLAVGRRTAGERQAGCPRRSRTESDRERLGRVEVTQHEQLFPNVGVVEHLESLEVRSQLLAARCRADGEDELGLVAPHLCRDQKGV